MNYLDRLISRALAIPRDSGTAVFDPFEQVADWPLDLQVPPAARTVNVPEVDLATIDPSPGAAARRSPSDRGEQSTSDASKGGPKAIAPGYDATVPGKPPRPQSAAPAVAGTATEPKPDESAAAPVPRAPLEIATDFMRSVAPTMVPDIVDEGAARPSRTPAPDGVPTRADASNTVQPPRSITVAGDHAAPTIATVMPPVPKPLPIASVQAERDRPTNTTPRPSAEARAKASAERPRPPAPTFAKVERPIVFDRSPSSRDELAHGTGILRFGIGQG